MDVIQDHLRRQDTDGSHNIIHMLDYFNFRNHKCITFELLNINLYELIKKNKFQGFSLMVSYSNLSPYSALFIYLFIHNDVLKQPNKVRIRHHVVEKLKINFMRRFILPFQLVRKFAYSMLLCLDLLQRNRLIHCDLKPENVLLKQQGRSGIKVSVRLPLLFLRLFW